jgi:hypothetical protein
MVSKFFFFFKKKKNKNRTKKQRNRKTIINGMVPFLLCFGFAKIELISMHEI